MKKLNAKIDVFFNAQKRDYYIRIRTSRREELPSYGDMTTDEQKQLLCAEYPEIANLLRKKKPSDEEIELDIDPKIKEYNERTRAMVRRRWKLFYCGSLRQINDEADSIILDKKVTTFTDLKYEGSLDDSAIIKFIQDHQSESGKDIYIAFECSECGQIEFGRLINGKATCTKCGHAIALTDSNVSKFVGENALMRAAQSVNEKKAKKSDEQQNASPAYLPKARSFYYNKTTYGINLPEFKALHEVLFSDCAIDKVFVTDDNGTISFSPDYDNYLRIICEKGVDTKLYKSKVRIIREINSASNALYGAMAGFYWYFNEFGLTKSSSLHWRVGDALFAFKSPQDYVSALCSADAKKRQAIISLFNEQTCQYFFKNYEYSIIELSHLIYDTTGRFVYIAENNDTFIDFDSNFINHLSDFDDKIAARNDFIEAIHGDRIFWDKIKGSMDDYDGYFSTADETYYDRLCFYQFAIQGKLIVKYKSLQIRDSKEGIEYIKSVVTSAYLRRDNNTQMRFRDLTQMLLKTALFNSMIIGTEGVVKSGQIGSIPFIERLTELVSETNNTPTIDAYLFCLNTINKRTKIEYNGNVDTLLNLAHAQIKAEKGDGIYVKFILDESINTVIKSILGESYENIQSESATFLDKVNSEIKKLQVEFDKKIEQFSADKVARRNTTQQSSEAVVERQPQTSYTTNETQVRRQGQNVTKKEDTSDEWA